jgi:hypothetical protein
MINSDAAAIEEKLGTASPVNRQVLRNHKVGSTERECLFGGMVLDRDLRKHLGRRGFRVRDVDRPVPSMIKNSRCP